MKYSVSIKGVVWEDDKVWLRKNERNEWELPGGKIDLDERPEETVIREIKEELGFKTFVKEIINVDRLHIKIINQDVLIVSYLLEIQDRVGNFEYFGEAGPAEFNSFSLQEIEYLNIPDVYKKMIKQSI